MKHTKYIIRRDIAKDFMAMCIKKHSHDVDYIQLLSAHARIAFLLLEGATVHEIYDMEDYTMYMSSAAWLHTRIGSPAYPLI